MAVLSNLEPKRVFEIFESLASIPHGSRNTKAISDWCVKFGEERGLECHQDAANNVILIASATPGYENAPAVILQGHLDMVCGKGSRLCEEYGDRRAGPLCGGRYRRRPRHHAGRG